MYENGKPLCNKMWKMIKIKILLYRHHQKQQDDVGFMCCLKLVSFLLLLGSDVNVWLPSFLCCMFVESGLALMFEVLC